MSKFSIKLPHLLILALLFSSSLEATLITGSKDIALRGATVDDFSSYPAGDPYSVSNGFFTMTQNGGVALNVTDNFNGSWGVLGRSVVSFAGTGIEITFAEAVGGFGIHLGAGTVGVTWTIEAFDMFDDSLGSDSVAVDSHARNNGFFIGWAGESIGSILLTPSAPDNVIWDNLSYAVWQEPVASLPVIPGSIGSVSRAIEYPADGGAGPAIWFKKARTPNFGSGPSALTLTHKGEMSAQRPDYFGSPQDAFALAGEQTQGAAIEGSDSTSSLAGFEASVIMMFQTPPIIDANASIIGRAPTESNTEPKFEVFLLSDGTLQLIIGETEPGDNTNIGFLAADTWYYLAVIWDLGLPVNQVSWYLGKVGELNLTRGYIDQVSAVGDPDSMIRVAGRESSNLFYGSYQNLAIYDRILGEKAVKNQFLATHAFRITNINFQPDATLNTRLRWTDNLSAAYQVVASDVLPFGGPGDLVIPVSPTNGELDLNANTGELEFAFNDPGATGSRRFWRVQVDLDETSLITDHSFTTATLQARIHELSGVGVININDTVLIDSPITIPSGIELNIEPGAGFDIQNATYFTILGSVSAGMYPIFNGIVNFVEGSVDQVKSEWWGSNDLAVNWALLSAGSIPVKVTNDLSVNSAILMNSNQTLDLYGATIFPSAPMTGGAVIKNRNSGATNITIQGGTFDGTAESTVGYDAILLTEVDHSLIKDVVCRNVHIRSSHDTGNVHLVNTSHTTIENCEFYSTWKMGIMIEFGSHNSIIGGYFYGTHDSGIGAISSPYLLIDGVYVDNCGRSDASNITVNLQYATIRNSISANGTGTDNGNGITIGHEGWPAIESVCENNLFINNSAKGVFLQGTTTRDVIVRNNIILDNGVGSSGLNSGGVAIYVGIRDSLIIDNEILGNRLGVSFMQTSNNNIVENNRIKSSKLYGVRSDGINNTLKDNLLANASNILNDVNEVNLIKINNTESGEETIDYSFLLGLPLTDLQRSVLEEYLN
jgi:hypothetical protein